MQDNKFYYQSFELFGQNKCIQNSSIKQRAETRVHRYRHRSKLDFFFCMYKLRGLMPKTSTFEFERAVCDIFVIFLLHLFFFFLVFLLKQAWLHFWLKMSLKGATISNTQPKAYTSTITLIGRVSQTSVRHFLNLNEDINVESQTNRDTLVDKKWLYSR